ncbi:hypothetical protein FKP32DRAFT_50483 [Trametes sanguinea]|nr:hypothetical protein FKP32DRAFT_50483 [Trametes sanguinea]
MGIPGRPVCRTLLSILWLFCKANMLCIAGTSGGREFPSMARLEHFGCTRRYYICETAGESKDWFVRKSYGRKAILDNYSLFEMASVDPVLGSTTSSSSVPFLQPMWRNHRVNVSQHLLHPRSSSGRL